MFGREGQMDKVFLGTRITEDTWRVRWDIAKHHPVVFRTCLAAFVALVLVIAVLV